MARGEKIFCSAATIMRLALVHAERGNLHDQHVLVFVHDQAAQEIALGVHNAKRRWLPANAFCRTASAARMRSSKNYFIHFNAFRREQADVDF